MALKLDKGGNKDAATQVGKALAASASAAGVEKVFFDRRSAKNQYSYHGRVEALIEGAREGGLQL